MLSRIRDAFEVELPLRDFFFDYKQLALAPVEWIQAVRLPAPPAVPGYYRKTGARRAQAIAKLSLAMLIGTADSRLFRAAAGAMSPFPQRLTAVEKYVIQCRDKDEPLREEGIRKQLAEDLKPIDDLRSTAGYRLRVAGNIICAMIKEAGLELD